LAEPFILLSHSFGCLYLEAFGQLILLVA